MTGEVTVRLSYEEGEEGAFVRAFVRACKGGRTANLERTEPTETGWLYAVH